MTKTETVLELVTPQARKYFYVGYAVVAGLIGAALAGFSAIGVLAPAGFLFASAAVGFLGTAFGLVAASNVSAGTEEETPTELGATDTEE